jgi:hypothetical protein
LSERIIQEARAAIEDFSTADAERLETVLTASQYQATPTPADEEIAENPTLVRDQKDIHVALAARNAKVDCLVSQDKGLTDPGEPIHKFITVLLPARFLREKMGWTSEALEAIRHRNWENMRK